ncbi:Protein of uncharacterised function (DUF3089) (plasmid) [Tsukamurella tyrosinosolvens]|uniref:DUF3089 domain-containing protein n=1 Tax=Tsukamurella tyrosinosolvens TaxID=57704 RepID=A0A1H4VQZ6_TSUTY|nr:DUF3089 domain-containing protein [Tsukamurella tyrosinosolvens]SEC83466.1 Protein of unknown function [Tsukamurella tyrosinosolvens]VEH90354.1 Protein of uncharacterised function (DUF3089) [Tsukamurella tyrosinosolvens]
MDITDLGTGKVTKAGLPKASDQPVDCFYVYPTVSNDLALNAQAVASPEVRSIATMQAARFSGMCRVFAPLYPQVPLAALAPASLLSIKPAFDTAYEAVRSAWRDYLSRDNGGRGVVFLGHSQGTHMLRKLLREEVDSNASVRSKVVGAFLLGGNVTTAPGSTRGGDFRNIPTCTSRGEYGCVVAYSTSASSPALSLFGDSAEDVTGAAVGLPVGAGRAVVCTDPAKLADEQGPVGVTMPSRPFAPGLMAALLQVTAYPQGWPTSSSTWTIGAGRGVGQCTGGKNNLYRITLSGPQTINELPLYQTHLIDLNFGLERLVSIARSQAASWQAR